MCLTLGNFLTPLTMYETCHAFDTAAYLTSLTVYEAWHCATYLTSLTMCEAYVTRLTLQYISTVCV